MTLIFLLVIVSLVPVALCIFLLIHKTRWQIPQQHWRIKLWLIGMIVITIFSFSLLVGLSLNLFPASLSTYTSNVFSCWLLSGTLLVPAATVFVAFGSGKLRRFGLLAAALTGLSVMFEISAAAAGIAGI